MGLFDKIFGKGKKQGTPYIDAGLALIYKLTTSLKIEKRGDVANLSNLK